MRVQLLYFAGCPSWRLADERLSALAVERGFELERRKVETPEQAAELGFRGSPTILVDGRDPFGEDDEPLEGLSCRVYHTPEGPTGVPTDEQLRDALS
ncbi:MAG: thioredoxin family protein [Actinomycetota bacterium]|nr:thioredoxin family protein [Actinomycetota bacterium]